MSVTELLLRALKTKHEIGCCNRQRRSRGFIVEENKTYYIYKITSTEDDGYYIGMRRLSLTNATVKECLKDPYLGSGGGKFKQWIKMVGKRTLFKEILHRTSNLEEAKQMEGMLVGSLYKDDPNCKNSAPGGHYGGERHPNYSSSVHLSECLTHGVSKFIGEHCYKCISEKSLSQQFCEVHGEGAFQGGECCKCVSEASISITECAIHGEVKHIGGSCYRCFLSRGWRLKECERHGESLHNGDSCSRCSAEDSISIIKCLLHGESLARGGTCSSCTALASISFKECFTHGLTKHRGEKCSKCNAEGKDSYSHCEVHGYGRFQHSQCLECVKGRRDSLKECLEHGVTKHRGEACYKCTAVKAAHSRAHVGKDLIQVGCKYCVEDEE